MSTRLSPTALHFKSLTVEGFRSIKPREFVFQQHNVIRGYHGVGKTSLIHLLAGVAGSDAATSLIADEPIGRLEVVIGAGNEEFRFEAKDVLDVAALTEFKESLPTGKRANFALSGFYYERFQYGECDYAEMAETLNQFWKTTGHRPFVNFRPGIGGRMDNGSGINQAIRLIFMNSLKGGPLMLDHPEGSLDYRNKRLMANMLREGGKQTIVVTHCTEWGTGTEKKFEMT